MKRTRFIFSKTYSSFLAVCLILIIMLAPQVTAEELDQQELMTKSIGDSQRELAIAVRDYENSLTYMEKAQKDVKILAQQVDSVNRQLAQAKNIYNRRLCAYYKTGPISFFEYVLTSKTSYEFSTRMDMMAKVGQQDVTLIKEIESLQADLNNRLKLLGQRYQSQSSYRTALAKKKTSIEQQLSIEQDRLNRVKEMGSIDGKMLASLPPQRSMPSRDLDTPSGRDSFSAQMIFPIAGAHAYQDTWGAPRSGGRSHKGTDIYANRGTPCVAVRDGVITNIDYHGLAGKYIRLTDGDGNIFAYIHLDGFAEGIFPGKPVTQGEVVGYVGNTGNASGGACHLHFEIHPGGNSPVNPYPSLVNCE